MRVLLLLSFCVFCVTGVLLAVAPPFGFFGGRSNTGGGDGIIVSADWGASICNSGGTCTVTSSGRTFTVPVGSSGAIQLSIQFGHPCTYNLNSAGETSFTDGQMLTVISGDVIAFRITSLAGQETDTITVSDVATSGVVGSFDGFNSAGAGP